MFKFRMHLKCNWMYTNRHLHPCTVHVRSIVLANCESSIVVLNANYEFQLNQYLLMSDLAQHSNKTLGSGLRNLKKQGNLAARARKQHFPLKIPRIGHNYKRLRLLIRQEHTIRHLH